MMETPRRKVKWDVGDISLPSLNSPFVDEPSVVSTSSLEYINTQLIAHGFVPSPGLALDGISTSASERVVKCLLGMLSQRMDDMARTEELSTKLRILSYDHERLLSMHRTAKESAANAEREMNLHKSRFLAAMRSLHSTEAAHKQTAAELQRTRNIVQGVRATHQSEIKKREKDIERMAGKWSKLADAQAKLTATPSGIQCLNVHVSIGSEVIGKGQGFLEIALEEAEKARSQLLDENTILRKLLLRTINEVQAIVHKARCVSSAACEEPSPYTLLTLFPLHPPENSSDKWNIVLADLRECLTTFFNPTMDAPSTSKSSAQISDVEIERLQGIIATLKEELDQSKRQSITQAAETRAMFDKFLRDHDKMDREIGEMSMELMSAPLQDAEKERLENIKQELEQERHKFTEAAIRLGKERAEIEAERLELLDEKRSWQVEMILAEFPPTPQAPASQKQVTTIYLSPKKSPRKSPVKVCVGRAGASSKRKATRVTRRSMASPSKILPSYETEVPPPIPAPMFNVKPPPATTLLPSSFVLPPPTPRTSLPTELALPPPLPALDFPSGQSSPEDTSSPDDLNSLAPSTPSLARRPFPVAKPFAQRMIHAYSPAKPSPLSRILMLGNSPNSPESMGLNASDVSSLLQPVIEEEECISGFDAEGPPSLPPSEHLSLAAELGIPESPPEIPLQEKKSAPKKAGHHSSRRADVTGATTKRVSKSTAREKGKAEVLSNGPAAIGEMRVRTSAGIEKGNSRKSDPKSASAPTRVFSVGSASDAKKTTKYQAKAAPGASTSRARIPSKLPPPGNGGPRRVPIDSDEVPPMMRARRG